MREDKEFDYKIEKDIPIPSVGKKSTIPKYKLLLRTLSKMEVGDCITMPRVRRAVLADSLYRIHSQQEVGMKDWRFTIRTIAQTIRVWRVQ